MLNEESLQETGVQNCDTVIICIAEKVDVSVLATITVLNMKVPNVIAKASDKEGITIAEIDVDYVDKLRTEVPCLTNQKTRRPYQIIKTQETQYK